MPLSRVHEITFFSFFLPLFFFLTNSNQKIATSMTFFNLCFVHTYKCQYLRLKINSPFMQWRVIFFFSSPSILQAIKRHCFPIFLVVQTAISWGQYREILFSSAPFSQIERQHHPTARTSSRCLE